MQPSITHESVVAFSQCERKAFLILSAQRKGTRHEYTKILQREACGVVVPDAEPAMLCKVLRELAADAPARARMGANARRAAQERYNWSISERGLLAAYVEP